MDIDREYDLVAEQAEPYVVEKSKKELGRMESILGAPQTIDALCTDILHHYEDYRQYELTGKAMIVAYSRPIALSISHKRLFALPRRAGVTGLSVTYTPLYERSFEMASAAWGMWS